ncbi:MAG: four helix bundle protein [Ferruginibacter sp.]
MNEDKENIIVTKTYAFALQIVLVYKELSKKNEYVLSKQLLRCGTSIGANIHEAVASESKKDFIHKLGIGLKEARECSYWLRLLKDTQYIDNEHFETLLKSCNEIIRILNSIILTTKERYLKSNS